jgi:hypothetical protein
MDKSSTISYRSSTGELVGTAIDLARENTRLDVVDGADFTSNGQTCGEDLFNALVS